MPITLSCPVVKPTKQRFYDVDRIVRGLAFDIHNEFGRLLSEVIYKRELANRCTAAGLDCRREVKATLKHGSFVKDYYIDLLLEHGVPLEAKTAESIVDAHRAQSMNYLYLAELPHGTLLNFRPLKVGHEFVTTTHTHESRRAVTFVTTHWKSLHPRMEEMRLRMMDLIHDWGALLDTQAYREALIFFMGGTGVIRLIDFFSDGHVIGQHEMPMLTDDIGFAMTSINRSPSLMRRHLLRFLSHTKMQAIAWINFNKNQICFETLQT